MTWVTIWSRVSWCSMSVWVLMAFAFAAPNQANAQGEAVQYEIVTIDTADARSTLAHPLAINGEEQVTGRGPLGFWKAAFVWDNGTYSVLGNLGYQPAQGEGINVHGQIVGLSAFDSLYGYKRHAFLYENGVMLDLGTFPDTSPYKSSEAYAITDSGLVAGWSHRLIGASAGINPYREHAFILDLADNSWTDLGTIPPDGDCSWNPYSCHPNSRAYDINESGHVTGWSGWQDTATCDCYYTGHAFLHDGNTMIDLGTLGGPELESWGMAINNAGQVTGYSEFPDQPWPACRQAFITDPATLEMVPLGTLGGQCSWAHDINDSGHVVGRAATADGPVEAFLYDGNDMVGLCSLVDCEAAGWTRLEQALAINNDGSIVGVGRRPDPRCISECDMGFLIRPITDSEGPVSRDVALTPSVVEVGAEAELTATVDDTETGNSDIVSAEYNIDGGIWLPMDGYWDGPTVDVYTVVAAPTTAGVYQVCVRGTDARDNVGEPECTFLVAYDPDGGFVTGGGWIDSPEGAYAPDPALIGKASFGFVSKYKKGASVPTGNTEFQFKAADLNFKSSSYEWLVIAGDNAKYKGEGTINGEGSYKFMLWGGDGTPDTFRLRIWTEDEATAVETDIYDNGFDQELGGGSVVIHKPK